MDSQGRISLKLNSENYFYYFISLMDLESSVNTEKGGGGTLQKQTNYHSGLDSDFSWKEHKELWESN